MEVFKVNPLGNEGETEYEIGAVPPETETGANGVTAKFL